MKELSQSPFPEQELAKWINSTLGQALCGLPLSNAELQVLTPNGQTNVMVRQVMKQIPTDLPRANLAPILPDLSSQEIAHQALKPILEPLKQRKESNKFGGVWNEWTARIAAIKLGLPDHKLARQIAAPGPVGQRLRQEQASIARQVEALLKRQLVTEIPKNAVLTVKLETWIKRQIDELRQGVDKSEKTLGKEARGEVIADTVSALIEVLNFATSQSQPVKLIRERLLAGRLGETINLVDLHCLSFINSIKDGILVSTSAADFVVKDANGNQVKISQNDLLEGVTRFAQILKRHRISHRVIVLVTDNDRFVLPGQSSRVDQFMTSLENLLQIHPLSQHSLEVIRASTVTHPEEFLPDWERRSGHGNSLAEKEVEQLFTKLQQRTLPPNLKTRRFARLIAGRSFTLQASLGKHVPELFHPAIVLQSSRAHQQAAEIFMLGNKQSKQPAIIISHWKGREKVID